MNREIVLIVITSVNLVFILFGFGESSVSYHLLRNPWLLALCVMWDRLWGVQDMQILESWEHVRNLNMFLKSSGQVHFSFLGSRIMVSPSFNVFKLWILQLPHFWDGDDYSYCTYRSTMLGNMVVCLVSRNSQYIRPNIEICFFFFFFASVASLLTFTLQFMFTILTLQK